MATEKFEIAVDLEPGADDLVEDEMMIDEDITARLKSNVTKRKGRGFSSVNKDTDMKIDEEYEKLDTDTPSGGKAQKSVEGWVIFVTGIHEEATEEDVKDAFADYGVIKNLRLELDRRTGFVKGYAILEFESFQEAKNAIEKTNGSKLLNSTIHCDFAFIASSAVATTTAAKKDTGRSKNLRSSSRR